MIDSNDKKAPEGQKTLHQSLGENIEIINAEIPMMNEAERFGLSVKKVINGSNPVA